MEEIARAGFWVAVGIVLAAWIIAETLKANAKERETQATLREMMRLEADGKLAPDKTLAYMRERDGVAAAIVAAAKGGDGNTAASVATGIGFLSFFTGMLLGIMSFAGTKSWVVPLIVMPSVWAMGGLIAAAIYFIFRKKKATPPGA